ncbi:MAG: small, acid-soluble spore protein, alpha/beta type [Limnochordia bacterium]|jgi:hypothetical protein
MKRELDTVAERAMEQLKQDLVEEMGLLEFVQTHGWGALAAKDCGRIGGKMSTGISPNILRRIAAAAKTQEK